MTMIVLKSNEALMASEPDQHRLAEIYEISKTDHRGAIAEYEKLSEKGSILAKLYLGYVHKGLKEYDRAVAWFEEAYKAGSIEGALQLGLMNRRNRRLAEAEPYFRHGADHGDPICEYNLGDVLYFLGEKRSRLSEIEEFYKSAISKGSIRAQNRLAFLYMRGSFGAARRITGVRLYFSMLYEAAVEAARDVNSRRLW